MKYLIAALLSAVLIVLKAQSPAQINNSTTQNTPVQTVTAMENEVKTDAPQVPIATQPPKVVEPERQQTVKPVAQKKGCEAYKHLIAQYDWDVSIATAVMRAESGCNPSATNKANRNGSVDRGLFQVNSVHKAKVQSLDDLYDPATNVSVAYRIHQSTGWQAWSAYKNGTYKRFL